LTGENIIFPNTFLMNSKEKSSETLVFNQIDYNILKSYNFEKVYKKEEYDKQKHKIKKVVLFNESNGMSIYKKESNFELISELSSNYPIQIISNFPETHNPKLPNGGNEYINKMEEYLKERKVSKYTVKLFGKQSNEVFGLIHNYFKDHKMEK
jgi:hypothetical protein